MILDCLYLFFVHKQTNRCPPKHCRPLYNCPPKAGFQTRSHSKQQQQQAKLICLHFKEAAGGGDMVFVSF